MNKVLISLYLAKQTIDQSIKNWRNKIVEQCHVKVYYPLGSSFVNTIT